MSRHCPTAARSSLPRSWPPLRADELGGDLAEAMAWRLRAFDVPGLEFISGIQHRFLFSHLAKGIVTLQNRRHCLHAGYAGFPLITSRKLAVDFAAAIADLPGSASAVQAYEDIVERPYKIEHLEHHADTVGITLALRGPGCPSRSARSPWRSRRALKKLEVTPPPATAGPPSVYAETVDVNYSGPRASPWAVISGGMRIAPGATRTCRPSRTTRTPSRLAEGLKKLGVARRRPRPSPAVYAETVDVNYSVEGLALGRFNDGGLPPRLALPGPAAHHGPLARRGVRGGPPAWKPGPSPSATAVGASTRRRSTLAFVYEFLELGHGGSKERPVRNARGRAWALVSWTASRAALKPSLALGGPPSARTRKRPTAGSCWLKSASAGGASISTPSSTGVSKAGEQSCGRARC